MAAHLGLLSMSTGQQQSYQENPPSMWMWNPKRVLHHEIDDDDSWEVRAFAEDTSNINGTTWPPRSYTCTFCRREFRSAQALGGHMNVHRRDRAKALHQHQYQQQQQQQQQQPQTSTTSIMKLMKPNLSSSSLSLLSQPLSSNSSSTLIIPTQEFSTNGGLCVLYQLPNNHSNNNPNGAFTTTTTTTHQTSMNESSSTIDSPSTLLSISSYPPSNNFHFAASSSSKPNHSTKFQFPSSIRSNSFNLEIEELDLELRLGHR